MLRFFETDQVGCEVCFEVARAVFAASDTVGRRRVLTDQKERESHNQAGEAENDERGSPVHVKQGDRRETRADERTKTSSRVMKRQRPAARLWIEAR